MDREFQIYQPATPIRIVAVQVGDGGHFFTEVPVLGCYHARREDGVTDDTDFVILDDCDRCPVLLGQSCWEEVGAKLIIGPASNPKEWWNREIAKAMQPLRPGPEAAPLDATVRP
jgi:hypothetical protein